MALQSSNLPYTSVVRKLAGGGSVSVLNNNYNNNPYRCAQMFQPILHLIRTPLSRFELLAQTRQDRRLDRSSINSQVNAYFR